MYSAAAPTQSILRKPPAAAILPLLLVLLCGIAVGALTMSLVIHKFIHTPTPAQELNKQTVQKWKKELNLTPAQQHDLEEILDDFSKYYDNVLADGKTRMMGILNEDQRRKLERLLEERRKQ